MKFYKIENNKFSGFYDSEIHLYNVTYKEEEKEIEEVITDEEGNEHKEVKTEIVQVPIYTLKEGFFELSDEKWQALLDGQSQGKEIRILKNGELGLYEKPTYEGTDLVKPVWNEEKETWEEGATKEEILIERKNKILEYKKIKNEVADLEEMAELDEDFASPETIKILKKKLTQLKQEIKKLGEIARKLLK